MGSVSKAVDAAVVLGRIRWRDSTPSLMGRVVTVGSRLQVFVQTPSQDSTSGGSDGVWLDADVLSIRDSYVEVRTSFARFIAEPSIACRWPNNAPLANRRELERVFAECVSETTQQMESLVERFLDDPMLKSSPLEQLLAYSLAMRECSTKVRAIASVLEGASQDLSARADRSMLVVGQSGRPASEAAGGPKRL